MWQREHETYARDSARQPASLAMRSSGWSGMLARCQASAVGVPLVWVVCVSTTFAFQTALGADTLGTVANRWPSWGVRCRLLKTTAVCL